MIFELNKVYNFSTRATAILGANVVNARLIGIVLADTARKSSNIDLQYRKIYPLLPSGTVNDVNSCIFYEFVGESGEKIILADQWIDMTSIQLVSSVTINVTVVNANISDANRIRDALSAMGYLSFNITTS